MHDAGHDYEVFAAAEAELGWFNGSWSIAAEQPFKVKEFIEDLLSEVAKKVEERGGEISHIKIHLTAESGSGKASLITLDRV